MGACPANLRPLRSMLRSYDDWNSGLSPVPLRSRLFFDVGLSCWPVKVSLLYELQARLRSNDAPFYCGAIASLSMASAQFGTLLPAGAGSHTTTVLVLLRLWRPHSRTSPVGPPTGALDPWPRLKASARAPSSASGTITSSSLIAFAASSSLVILGLWKNGPTWSASTCPPPAECDRPLRR